MKNQNTENAEISLIDVLDYFDYLSDETTENKMEINEYLLTLKEGV